MAILMNPNKNGQETTASGKRLHYDTYPFNSDTMLFHMYHERRRRPCCNPPVSILGPLTFVSISLMFLIIGFAAGSAYTAQRTNENDIPRIAPVPELVGRQASSAPMYSHGIPLRAKELVTNRIQENLVVANDQCSLVEDNDRIDCNPDDPVGEGPCTSRGCCWAPPKGAQQGPNVVMANMPPLNTPYCFYPANYKGYKVNDISQTKDTITATLERVSPSGFKDDIKNLKVNIELVNDYSVRIKIVDANKRRYEVPVPKLNVNKKEVTNPLYDVQVTKEGLLTVSRKSTGAKVFSADLSLMTYADQYLALTTKLPTDTVYGLGEQKAPFVKKADSFQRFTMFNRDQPPTEGWNLYGAHPFYQAFEDENGNTHGVFLFNSNGMDIILSPTPAITYRAIGGIFDFFVFMGPSPAEVTKQYLNLIGLPHLPPYWGLGFHLCKYGYGSLNRTREVWQRTVDSGIPFDVQWNDIDYMDNNKDFTYDKNKFAGLPEFVKQVHDLGQKYVIITDPGVSSAEPAGTYPPFDDGVKMGAFVMNSTGQLLIGKVWTGSDTVWPDFTNPKATLYWTRQVKRFHDEVGFDGLWIDMNEPSNFVAGQKDGCPDSPLEHPQYLPGGRNLADKTLCMTGKQYAGLHYDVHNLYGFTETISTNVALRSVRGKRPFIISRSTFPGQGHFGGHWDGDISSSWDHMKWTIGSIMEMNFLGIPLIGGDICGFNGNTDPEMCARWMALGAFYPFSRNHNSDNSIDQDPVALGPQVVSSSKYALRLRYTLLPHLYTLFSRAHRFAETVARPLYFEFPNDKQARQVDSAFMWGSSVYIVPVIEQGKTSVDGYFPAGSWLKFEENTTDYKLLKSTGQTVTLNTPIDRINVFVRDGSIVPTLPAQRTTTETRKGKYSLIVHLDGNQQAKGDLYHDDGDSLDTVENGKYNTVEFTADKDNLKSTPTHVGAQQEAMPLERIVIVGLTKVPSQVTVNDQKVNFRPLVVDGLNGNSATNGIEVYDLSLDLKQSLVAKWQ